MLLPPRYVEYMSALPAGLSLEANASSPPPKLVVCSAPAVTGKSVELVAPVTYAAPVASTAMAVPASGEPTMPPDPPRYVLYTSPFPEAFNFATKASWFPPLVDRRGAAVGKLVEVVPP